MSNDSVGKTLGVATLLCVVCSILVSTAAVELRPVQEKNKLLDKQKNILLAAGLWKEGGDVERIFASVESRVVELSSGEFVEGVNPVDFSQREAAKDPRRSESIETSMDLARIKRRAKKAVVYLIPKDGPLEKVVLPVHGKGLWSTMYGFIALGSDLNTIEGFAFYEHGETPGLGGEVDNPKWKALWKGKKAFGDDGDVKIEVIKGQVNSSTPDGDYKVDGLSGATITSRGVSGLLHYWLGENGFGPFLQRMKQRQQGSSDGGK